ncbi:hypothetical protein ACET3Z_012399 [Daucus carota]
MVTRKGLKKVHKEQVEQLVSGMANISMNNEEEAGKMLSLSAVYSREEELMKMKMEVREKVEAHLRRVEEDAKRLAVICKEFEALKDPVRKGVIECVGDKDDWVNSEYKSLAWSCIKKEKKYREALEALEIFCKLNQAQYESTKEMAAPETNIPEVSEAVLSDGHSETKSETEQGSDLISTDKEVDIKTEKDAESSTMEGLRKTRRTIQKPERFEHSANHIKKGKGKNKKKL